MRMNELPTPCFVVDEALVEDNLKTLRGVMDRTGCKILLAQKAFSMFPLYPLVGRYLAGAAASGLYEARLGAEMGGENHVFCAAFREGEFAECATLCDHIIFNSFGQLERFGDRALAAGKSVGVRVNPMHSTQGGEHAVYDPCSSGSRLGVTLEHFRPDLLERYRVEGLHFHTLCEQDAAPLAETVAAVENQFAPFLPRMKWINLGGGHHITRPGYDIPLLEQVIAHLGQTYDLQVYLEPGEAVALNAGFLVATVLDVVENGMQIAILDTSAACHMPDVLEMPYRPPLQNSGEPGEKPCLYRLAGPTCLAGDVIGDYSFDTPLQVGDRLVFADMAIYSMVKTNTFNGMPLPGIAVREKGGDCRMVKTFGYEDFKGRLG